MKVDGSLGSLLQGVSQQAPRDRFDGQCSLQENMTSDPVKGLSRRPPTDLVGLLGSASSVLGWHNFQTRDGRKFLAMYKEGDVSVFDLNADAQTVTVDPLAVAYLTGTTNMRSLTDDQDSTVIVNPSVKTATTTSKPAYANTGARAAAVFQVLGGAYGATYTIYIDGVMRASYRPPGGTSAGDAVYAGTTHIAMRLEEALFNTIPTGHAPDGADSFQYGTAFCATEGYTVSIQGDIFWIRHPTSTFTVSVGDGSGGVNFKGCTDNVTDIADLPRAAPHLYAVRIAENTEQAKDLWFKFIVSDLGDNGVPDFVAFGRQGYWKECVAPDTDTEFDESTMPHKMTYDSATSTFNVSLENYVPRAVGTTVSNPDPSFVGNTINDVSSLQGRLVLLSGSNCIMSRTNRPTNFYRGSASALADTDPIDINSKADSSPMIAAVSFNKDLAIFTPKGQHIVFGRTGLTPGNAAIAPTTKFESELGAHPVGAGRNVFFPFNFGRYTGIREFYSEASTDHDDSRPVTQHVNKYLVGKTKHLTASSNFETLLVHTDDNQADLYVYQYIWQDEKKVQSAWSTWKWKHDIVYSFFDQDILYMVERLGDDHYLLRMPLDVQESVDYGYAVYLDHRFDVFGCNDAFVLPYDFLKDEELVVVQGADCPTPGLRVAIKSIDNVPGTGWVVTLKHDMLGGDIVVGTRFLSRYMPTMPAVKDANGVVLGTAKTRAKSFLISLDDTGYIAGRVRSKYGDGPEVAFNARVVGDIENTVGEQPLSNEQFTLPYRQNVNDAEIELYTDSHLPMTLADIEYVGQYTKRGKRIANSNGGNN